MAAYAPHVLWQARPCVNRDTGSVSVDCVGTQSIASSHRISRKYLRKRAFGSVLKRADSRPNERGEALRC
jgi:hypothetical protein